MKPFVWWCFVWAAASCMARAPAPRSPAGMTSGSFHALLERVADGWNRGDARAGAACFAEDAVYEEPPAKQLYRGRAALYAFFGGEAKLPMHMRWHHVAFDEKSQVGFGEYTFALNSQYHGVVVAKVRDGVITHWREYQVKDSRPFEEFVKESRF